MGIGCLGMVVMQFGQSHDGFGICSGIFTYNLFVMFHSFGVDRVTGLIVDFDEGTDLLLSATVFLTGFSEGYYSEIDVSVTTVHKYRILIESGGRGLGLGEHHGIHLIVEQHL